MYSNLGVLELVPPLSTIPAQCGITPLMYVIGIDPYRCGPIVDLLMELGASLKTRNEEGNTPFECALRVGTNSSRYLLDYVKVLAYNAMK